MAAAGPERTRHSHAVLLGGFDAGADDSGVTGAERGKHDDHLPAAECNSSENATPSQNATEISAANMMITSLRQPKCNSSDNVTPSQNATLLGDTANSLRANLAAGHGTGRM